MQIAAAGGGKGICTELQQRSVNSKGSR
jgi:hypothetical protein